MSRKQRIAEKLQALGQSEADAWSMAESILDDLADDGIRRPSMTVVDDYVTVEEAARLLGKARTTTYVMVRAGEIESCLVAGRRLIRREVVEAIKGAGSE